MQKEIVMEVWGDFACFSRPESKVERLSYPVMTPSAARGILSAVYSKPAEFYWQVKKIEVLRPIQYISFKRNEVINAKIGPKPKPILVEDTRETGAEHRTQRQSVVLKDVRYRITAEIIKRDSFEGSIEQLYIQTQRRIDGGKCFYQPSLGLREYVCYFDNPSSLKPIEESLDLGIMLYDVFDLHKFEVTKKAEPYISLFHARMENGVVEIPDFDSELVLKP
jgi:CRISPR-associated protein Cas5d